MIKETEMDLVQRDLDGDLTLAEKETLQLLLAKNPELQLMHDRLQKVSRQLADLPPVTPAFSLVDAILPKLGSDSLKPVPAMPQLEREELPTLEWKPQEESVAKKSLIPIWFTKVGSGLAAACLLFGLFFLVKGAIDDKSAPGSQPGGTVVVNPVSTEPDPPAPKEPAIQQPAPPTVAPPKPAPKPNAQVKNPQPPLKKPTVAKPTAPAQKPSKPAAAAQPAKPTDRGPIFPGAGSSMPGATPSDIEVAPVKKADQGKSDGTKEPQSGDDEKDKGKKNDDKKEEKQEDKQDDKNNGKNDDDDDKNDDDNEDENDDD